MGSCSPRASLRHRLTHLIARVTTTYGVHNLGRCAESVLPESLLRAGSLRPQCHRRARYLHRRMDYRCGPRTYRRAGRQFASCRSGLEAGRGRPRSLTPRLRALLGPLPRPPRRVVLHHRLLGSRARRARPRDRQRLLERGRARLSAASHRRRPHPLGCRRACRGRRPRGRGLGEGRPAPCRWLPRQGGALLYMDLRHPCSALPAPSGDRVRPDPLPGTSHRLRARDRACLRPRGPGRSREVSRPPPARDRGVVSVLNPVRHKTPPPGRPVGSSRHMDTSSRRFSPLVLVLALVVVLGAGWYVSQQGTMFGSSTEVSPATTTSPQSTEPVVNEAETVITEESTQIGEFTAG